MKPALRSLIALAAGLATLPALAADIIPNTDTVSGVVSGTLVVIDVPYQSTIPVSGPIGPDWTDDADDGLRVNSASSFEADHGQSPWEPNGTVLAQARTYRQNGGGGSIYTFNQADSGINLKNNLVIHAVYATWLSRGVSGATWSYNEGTLVSSNVSQTSAASADLVLKWADSASTSRNANFQKIFSGPIVVAGSDGFQVKAVRSGNTHQCDAVVLDVGFPPKGTVVMLY